VDAQLIGKDSLPAAFCLEMRNSLFERGHLAKKYRFRFRKCLAYRLLRPAGTGERGSWVTEQEQEQEQITIVNHRLQSTTVLRLSLATFQLRRGRHTLQTFLIKNLPLMVAHLAYFFFGLAGAPRTWVPSASDAAVPVLFQPQSAR